MSSVEKFLTDIASFDGANLGVTVEFYPPRSSGCRGCFTVEAQWSDGAERRIARGSGETVDAALSAFRADRVRRYPVEEVEPEDEPCSIHRRPISRCPVSCTREG